jgi:hypothetical protein
MLSTIAKRFGKSRDELAKDVLSNALIDLLTQLEPGERKLIARDADEMGASMSREIAEENGLKDIEHKPNIWTGHERNIAKAEKKRAKELEEARKANKKVQASADFKEEVSTSNELASQDSMEESDVSMADASAAIDSNETETAALDVEAGIDTEAELDSLETEEDATEEATREEQAPVFA